MRTIYGLSVDEKVGESLSGITDKIYNAITHTFPTMESAMKSAWKLLDEVDTILSIEVYVDTFYKDEIKREYIVKLSV